MPIFVLWLKSNVISGSATGAAVPSCDMPARVGSVPDESSSST
jgi:hypothetical protein